MSAQHTPGRLSLELVESDSGTIRHLCPVDKDGLSVLTVVEHEGVQFAAVYLDDDARRLVACWNACDGLSTESLETAGNVCNGWKLASYAMNDAKDNRDELLAALKEFHLWAVNQADAQSKGGHATFDWMMLREQRDIAAEAIAKATGEQA